MKHSKILYTAAVCGSLMLGTDAILANSVETPPDSFVLDETYGYSLNEMFTGDFYVLKTFEVTQAGTYVFTIADTGLPTTLLATTGDDPGLSSLEKLAARVSTPDEKLATLNGNDSAQFEMQPGTYYLSLFAQSASTGKNGGFSLTLSQNGIAEVPAPAAAWLFGSGLLGLLGTVRRRL
ncbi:MAG: hypothetical protein HY941_10120 [Gammaproteobacteria bacterium]|nr:hypothetical protein [Gammaproteobacteria bacterium]